MGQTSDLPLISWTMLPLGGRYAYGQLLWLPYWSGGTELTLGQDLFVKVPHEVNALLRGDPYKWLLTSRITQYQGLLRENPHVYY